MQEGSEPVGDGQHPRGLMAADQSQPAHSIISPVNGFVAPPPLIACV